MTSQWLRAFKMAIQLNRPTLVTPEEAGELEVWISPATPDEVANLEAWYER